jgi:hypothetical protein
LKVIFTGSGSIARLTYSVCDTTWCGDGEFNEIRSKVTANGNAVVDDFTIRVAASLIPSNNFDISGNAVFKTLGNITDPWDAIYGNHLSIFGDGNITGDLTVSGNIIGNIQLPDPLTVNTLIAGTVCATTNVEVDVITTKTGSTITIQDNLDVDGTLNADGNVTLNSNLTVSDVITSDVVCANTTQTNTLEDKTGGTITIDANVSLLGNIVSDTNIEGNLTVTGNIIGITRGTIVHVSARTVYFSKPTSGIQLK